MLTEREYRPDPHVASAGADRTRSRACDRIDPVFPRRSLTALFGSPRQFRCFLWSPGALQP